MIRARFEVEPQSAKDLRAAEEFLQDFDAAVGGLMEDTYNTIGQPMLDDLKREAGPVVYPIAWTSERQRRAFFATDGFGRGIPTRRTRRMINSWDARLKKRGNAYEIVVSNDVSYTRFVVGVFRIREPEAAIQRFHRNTGWRPVHTKVDYWFTKAQEDFESRFERYLANIGIFRVRRRNR